VFNVWVLGGAEVLSRGKSRGRRESSPIKSGAKTERARGGKMVREGFESEKKKEVGRGRKKEPKSP